MELAGGFKQTDIGRLPSDWAVVPLASIAAVTSGKRLPLGHYVTDKVTAHPYIRVTDMRPGKIDVSEIKYVPDDAFAAISRYRIFKTDIFISVAGSLGIVGRIPAKLDGANLTENANRIGNIRCDRDYLLHVLMAPVVQDVIDSTQTVGAQPKLALTRIRTFLIPLPPTAREQSAIAAALTDLDELITGLENLIAKKRALKQAAMQQLLTGQTRLPGFSGEWSFYLLRHLCDLKSGEAITSDSIDDHSPYRCFGGNGLRGHTSTFTHDGHFALIGRQGALCGNVSSVEGRFFASEHALVVTPAEGVSIDWLAVVLERMNLNQYSESSAQPGLSAAKLLVLDVWTPPSKDEQAAIAKVLSDFDAELAVLESRLAKTRALKLGMMQELLTGRTRLV